MMFDPSNPVTWMPRESRNDSGTLLCICNEPGHLFVSDGVEVVDGKEFGILRGLCCEKHLDLYRGRKVVKAPTVDEIWRMP